MWKSRKTLFSLKRVNHFPPLGKALLASEGLDSSKVWKSHHPLAKYGVSWQEAKEAVDRMEREMEERE